MDKKIALITGATSGIGRACALRLHQDGFRVIITGRRQELLDSLSHELGTDCISLCFDIRDCDGTNHAINSLPHDWQNIDVLINNAGLALGLEPEYEGDITDWTKMIDTNIKGLLYTTRLVVPGMRDRSHGHIINIGSVAGDTAYANGAVYCATKSAVKTLTDGLRIDLVDTPIRVTLVKPGLVETDFSRVRFHGDTDRADKVYHGIEPLTASDIADTVMYAVQAPTHVQIAEVLVLATYQANGYTIARH